jgi:TolB-like protein/Tfp pilus assembly protein PilF
MPTHPNDILNTWKAIADYLDRDVRTVQRWEGSRNLPVHRLPGDDKSAVFARRSELDAWRGGVRRPPEAQTACSVAVLPFLNVAGDEALAYGVADGIINAMTAIPGLRVSARTSSFAATEPGMDAVALAAKLGVDALLEGSLQSSPQGMRVQVQLIGAQNGMHLWGRHYEFAPADIFHVQDQIAGAVGERLTGVPCAPPRIISKVSMTAYRHWASGRYCSLRLTPGSMQTAADHFAVAVSADPDFALAHLGLAEHRVLSAVWGFEEPHAALEAARALAQEAISRDAALGEAHAVLGACCAILDFDWTGAEHEFRRGLRSNPSSGLLRRYYALFCLEAQSRLEEAEEQLMRVLELDPLSPDSHAHLAHLFMCQRRYGDAMRQSAQALDIDASFPMAHWVIAAVQAAQGDHGATIPAYEQAAGECFQYTGALGPLGYNYARCGRAAEAHKLLDLVVERMRQSYVSPLTPSWICLGLRDWDACFRWLSQAVATREPQVLHLPVKPLYDELKLDERFGRLLAEMRIDFRPGSNLHVLRTT